VAPLIGGALGAVVWKLATGGDDLQTGEEIGEAQVAEEGGLDD